MDELLKIWPNGKVDKVFTKIFDLKPFDVEIFIREQVIEQIKRNCEDDNIDWLKDYDLEIKWCVSYNEFYVDLEPKLDTKDYKIFSFKGKENITAGEYFELKNEHWHFSFQEIYGKMTGETTFISEIGVMGNPDIAEAFSFIYHGTEVHVYYTTKGEWYIPEWDDKSGKRLKKPVPEDLLSMAIAQIAE